MCAGVDAVSKLLLVLLLIPNLVLAGGMGGSKESVPGGNPFEFLKEINEANPTNKKGKQSEEWTSEMKVSQEKLKNEHQSVVYVKTPIPDMLPEAQKALLNKNIKWYESFIGHSVGEPVLRSDKTKIDRLSDGTFVVPVYTRNRDGAIYRAVYYERVDCRTKTVEELGSWSKNLVGELGTFQKQERMNKGSVGFNVLNHVCGFEMPVGSRVANLFLAYHSKGNLLHIAYDLNNIKKIDESNYIMALGEVNIMNGSAKKYAEFQDVGLEFNCSEKSFMSWYKNGLNAPFRKSFLNNPDDENDVAFVYPIEKACEYVRVNPSSIEKVKVGDMPAKNLNGKNKHEEPEINNPKISIDDAKSQCSDIGFKAGTERFGECVLELMQ